MKKDVMTVSLKDDEIQLAIDYRFTSDILAILIHRAEADDNLRDMLLTAAANLLAAEKDSITQLKHFSRITQEIINQKKEKKTNSKCS